MIVHYPPGIADAGGVRNQFLYVNDIAPTILEITGVEPRSHYRGVDQMPITGTSMAYTLGDADCPSRKPIQHFEMVGKRGLWCDGWKAVTRHEPSDDYDDDVWELYHLEEDFSESNNLAEAEPERLRKMIQQWWVEARRNGVLPLDDRGGGRGRSSDNPRTSYRFVPPMAHVPRVLSPPLTRGNWSLTADVEIMGGETEGVIYAQGSFLNGFSLFLQDGKLAFVNTVMDKATVWRAESPLPSGRITVEVIFEKHDDNTGTFTLKVQGNEVGTVGIADTTRMSSMRGVDVARDQDAPVTDLYQAPFDFTGVIHSVEVQVVPG